MTLEQASKILSGTLGSDGSIHSHGLNKIRFEPGNNFAEIDADLSAEELEAIAVVMRKNIDARATGTKK